MAEAAGKQKFTPKKRWKEKKNANFASKSTEDSWEAKICYKSAENSGNTKFFFNIHSKALGECKIHF